MTPLCHIDDIPEDSSKSLEFDGKPLLAVKKGGRIYVYQNRCPHLGVELNWNQDQFLDTDNALIQCATHGALFLIDNGRCVAGPCLGKSLQAFPFSIVNQHIMAAAT
jgi:nitrite reductase/ring-hydroxylating ferredoxin subunit